MASQASVWKRLLQWHNLVSRNTGVCDAKLRSDMQAYDVHDQHVMVADDGFF